MTVISPGLLAQHVGSLVAQYLLSIDLTAYITLGKDPLSPVSFRIFLRPVSFTYFLGLLSFNYFLNLFFLSLFLYFETRSHNIALTDLELSEIHLLLPPKCRDKKVYATMLDYFLNLNEPPSRRECFSSEEITTQCSTSFSVHPPLPQCSLTFGEGDVDA